MTPSGSKRLAIALSVVALILGILAAWGWSRAIMNELRATLADGWTQMLQEGRDGALKSTNVVEIAGTLRWVGYFYRAPVPPAAGIERHHYNLMERVRDGYQREIVAHLRDLTGEQLGEDPKSWIDRYAKPER